MVPDYQYDELADSYEIAKYAIKQVISLLQDGNLTDAEVRVRAMEQLEEWIDG